MEKVGDTAKAGTQGSLFYSIFNDWDILEKDYCLAITNHNIPRARKLAYVDHTNNKHFQYDRALHFTDAKGKIVLPSLIAALNTRLVL